MDTPPLSREAVPGLTQTQYDAIEDTMRHVVFHSTLDWQTRDQLHEGARQAFAILSPEELEAVEHDPEA